MKTYDQLLICDLDNTLYDWIAYFVPSFYAMVDKVVELTGCDRNALLDDFRTVHQAAGDSEQPYSLTRTNTIREFYKGLTLPEIMAKLDPAFYAFNKARKENLKLYPGVREVLDILRKFGRKASRTHREPLNWRS